MNGKDRMIVTFGGDPEEKHESAGASNHTQRSVNDAQTHMTDLTVHPTNDSAKKELNPADVSVSESVNTEPVPTAAPVSIDAETDFTPADPQISENVNTDPVQADPTVSYNAEDTGLTPVDPPVSENVNTEPVPADTPVSVNAGTGSEAGIVSEYEIPEFDYAAPDAGDTDFSIYEGPILRKDTANSYDASATPHSDQGVIDPAGSAAAGSSRRRSDRNADNRKAASTSRIPAPKDPRYVTKGALVICMIITMLVSSVVGALAGGLLVKDQQSTTRDDSKLSELNLSDSTGSDLSVSEIVKKNEDAVVEIVVSGTRQGLWGQLELAQGAGSGVIIREDGYIATNHHVIDGATKVQVTLHNGDSYQANIIGSDPANDIAVIKIDAKDLTTAEIGDSSKVAVGDLAVAIGNPLGQLGGTATEGIISALDRNLTIEGTTLTLLQTDAAINGGNSGGGLFNGKGELIGIVESKASAVGVEGLAFALPINSVAEIINDFIENGGSNVQKSGTPAIGITISDVSEENAQYYNLESAGVYVAKVTGENAMRAGFQEGDRLISFNGKEITNSSEFIELVRKCKVGDTVTVVVSRNGQQMEIKTELEALSIE